MIPLIRSLRSALLLALVLCGPLAADEPFQVDHDGRLKAIVVSGETVRVSTDLAVVAPRWTSQSSLASWREHEPVQRPVYSGGTWSSVLRLGTNDFQCGQTMSWVNGGFELAVTVTAERAANIEGLYMHVTLPIGEYGGGACELRDGDTNRVNLPASSPAQPRLWSGRATHAEFRDAAGHRRVAAYLPEDSEVVLQDNRRWADESYDLFFPVHTGLIARHQTVRARLRLEAAARVDDRPVHLHLTPGAGPGRMDGFGGNYCFQNDSPVSAFTLQNLHPAWVRTEMDLALWEPANDNDDPNVLNGKYYQEQDRPGSKLRKRFLFESEIAKRGIPSVVSVWSIPEWLCDDRGRGAAANGRRIARSRWPEFLEMTASYLQHLKTVYHAEPEYFSFNEPDMGIRVQLSAADHAALNILLARRFEAMDLKTRPLLGDVANASAIEYARDASRDKAARDAIGAVAFHSWNTRDPRDYEAWAVLAARLNKPLLVTELGVDPGAWEEPWRLDSFDYGLRETLMTQQIVNYAHPRATMFWEFTPDYRLVVMKDEKPAPTIRYWLVRHFCDLTPAPADVLQTDSESDKVVWTAYRGVDGKANDYTFHIVNMGAARTAIITGLPDDMLPLRAVVTTDGAPFRDARQEPASDGILRVALPARSLVTLLNWTPPPTP